MYLFDSVATLQALLIMWTEFFRMCLPAFSWNKCKCETA